MPNKIVKKLSLIALFLAASTAHAVNITQGGLIQTIHADALKQSADMTVADFFDAQASSTRLFSDLEKDVVLGPPPLSNNQFFYSVNSPTLRIPNRSTQPSDFSYDANNLLLTAKGGIGLGGVMRLDLSDNRYFLWGDWSIEYDENRKNQGGSGWFMRNLYQIPIIFFDILETTVIENSDGFFLSGNVGWSPEIIEGLGGAIPASELLKVVADIALCAEDGSLVNTTAEQQIPCVFPNIKLNGQMGDVNVNSANEAKFTLELGVATQEKQTQAEYFAAFVFEGAIYWLNNNFEWTTNAGAAYQGALANLKEFAIPAPSLDFPSNSTIPVYFGVDTNLNNIFDQPYRFSVVNMKIN